MALNGQKAVKPRAFVFLARSELFVHRPSCPCTPFCARRAVHRSPLPTTVEITVEAGIGARASRRWVEVNTWRRGNSSSSFRARIGRLPGFTDLGKQGDSK